MEVIPFSPLQRDDEMDKLIKTTSIAEAYVIILFQTQLLANQLLIQNDDFGNFSIAARPPHINPGYVTPSCCGCSGDY
jgi:hypothetical protein